MAFFTNVIDLQAALSACVTVRDWEMLTEAVEIPENLMPLAFALCDKANSDLYHLIRDNNTGGPSIIFHRYHEAGKTKIREAEKGQAAKLCEKNRGLRSECTVPLGSDAEYANGKLYKKIGGK